MTTFLPESTSYEMSPDSDAGSKLDKLRAETTIMLGNAAFVLDYITNAETASELLRLSKEIAAVSMHDGRRRSQKFELKDGSSKKSPRDEFNEICPVSDDTLEDADRDIQKVSRYNRFRRAITYNGTEPPLADKKDMIADEREQASTKAREKLYSYLYKRANQL